MTNTTYYNLKKPGDSDNVLISDLNENMDILDQALHDMDDQVGRLWKTISFTSGQWSGGTLRIRADAHGMKNGLRAFQLFHQVDGALSVNTWAVRCTDVIYESSTGDLVLKCEDAYAGQICVLV